jgi:hypothetical protein
MTNTLYKYNFQGENKHTMVMIYDEIPSGYFSYYFQDYEGSDVVSKISTNLSSDDLERWSSTLISNFKSLVGGIDYLIEEFNDTLEEKIIDIKEVEE